MVERAQRAGLLKVPVVVRQVADEKLLQVALIENIQRENLNPIEEAQAYRRLVDDMHLSQEAVASAVGKDRATVANSLRLLRLPAEVRGEVAGGVLTMGHARALLALPDDVAQRRVAREVIARALSVRETEALVRKETTPSPEAERPIADPNTRAAEDQPATLTDTAGNPVLLTPGTTWVELVPADRGGVEVGR